MAREIETDIGWCEDNGVAWVSSNEQRWINCIHKLKEQRPDDVTILKEPQDNGGFIYAKCPQKWVRIRPPRNISEETRNRLISYRKPSQCESSETL